MIEGNRETLRPLRLLTIAETNSFLVASFYKLTRRRGPDACNKVRAARRAHKSLCINCFVKAECDGRDALLSFWTSPWSTMIAGLWVGRAAVSSCWLL